VSYTLSVIIPVFNEYDTIEEIIKRTRAVELPEGGKIEIVIVDDYSTDGTRDLYPKLRDQVDKIVYHKKNRGKGAALRTGFRNVTGDYVVIQDADLEYDPKEFTRLLGPLLRGQADVVYGSRFLGAQEHRVVYYWHRLGNMMLTTLSNMFTDINLTDMETCYKMFRRSSIDGIVIEEDRFGFEPEITAKCAKRRLRFYEVGITYHGRTYEEGKKIGLRDAFRALYCIIKYTALR